MAIERAANVATFRLEAGSLGSDVLGVLRMRATEGLSQVFAVDLELVSEDGQIAFEDVLGQDATFVIDTGSGTPRTFKGIISRFEQGAVGARFSRYYARIVPHLWKLGHRTDCRIFQEMTVKDIVDDVLERAGIGTDTYEWRTQGEFKAREFCVQYRETDLDFVSRLLEDEGIFYFYEYGDDGSQTLVFGDSTSAYIPILGDETELPYREPRGQVSTDEHVSTLRLAESVRTGSVAIKDFSFKTPKVPLEGANASGSAFDDLEFYDSPAELFESGHVSQSAEVRLDEMRALTKVATGVSVCHRLTPGHKFSLREHERSDFNSEFTVVELVHEGYEPEVLGQERPDLDEETTYANDFRAVPSDVIFRPPRITPRPYIRGTQSATVVGPEGEEIYCDEYGRIKVQFHWDRVGENDEHSSCYVRVSQQWAGPGYGFQTIPRIGNEVIVGFFEGNPDRPHVIGRVYNAENMPPYTLPDNKTQTGIKSESSKGGEGFNEIRMEDLKGEEQLYVQAERNMDTVVKNDQTHRVGNLRTREVGADETVNIGANRTVAVGETHTEQIGTDEELNVGGNRTRAVGGDETVSVTGNQTLSVEGAVAVTIGKELAENVGASHTTEVGEDYTQTVGGAFGVTVAQEAVVQADKIQLEAKSELSIRVGKAKLVMKSNGDITLEGKKINVKGSGDVIIKGSKVKAN